MTWRGREGSREDALDEPRLHLVPWDPGHVTEKNLFWAVVDDCLQEIFGISASEADARSQKLRCEVEKTRPKRGTELFYHAEPIDVAADLAGKGRKLKSADWRKYDAILARRKW
jgi:hypothetical protein